MQAVLLFISLLLMCFAVLYFLLKPSAIEASLHKHLIAIEESRDEAQPAASTILKNKAFSSNPQLDALVRKVPGSEAVARMTSQAGKEWHVASLFAFSIVAIPIGWWFASLFIPSLLLSGAVALAISFAPYGYIYVLRGLRFAKFDKVLPEAVDLMARGLRAGHSVNAVLEMVGTEVGPPVGPEFMALYKEQGLGLPLREALTNLLERMPRDDVRFLTTAILLQKESGGNLAQILDKTASVLRDRARLRGQLRIYTAQGRLTGWILGAAPFIMFGVISAVNHEYEWLLFSSPIGWYMIYAGLVMIGIGALIIRKIIDIKV